MESQGIDEVINIGKNFGIDDINLIKPGIGETTRVLLRRIPWKVLIDERYKGNPQLEHIVRLSTLFSRSGVFSILNSFSMVSIKSYDRSESVSSP